MISRELAARRRAALAALYSLGLTYGEIATQLGRSKARARQLVVQHRTQGERFVIIDTAFRWGPKDGPPVLPDVPATGDPLMRLQVYAADVERLCLGVRNRLGASPEATP